MRISDCSSDVCSSDLNSHQRSSPMIETCTMKLEKCSCRLSFSDRSRRLVEMPMSAPELPAMRSSSGLPSTSFCVRPRAKANRGEAERTRRKVSICHSQSASFSSNSRSSNERSEEHTSELQSLMRISYAVFCLKKKIIQHIDN